MIAWISFAILGCLFGIFLSVSGFVILMVLVLAVYASALAVMRVVIPDLAIAVLVAAVALQVGYFVCVVLRIAIRRFRGGTGAARNAPMEGPKNRSGIKDDTTRRSVAGWFTRRPTERHR